MILRAIHKTLYEYAYPASSSHNEVRLMPATNDHQNCLEFKLSITPQATIFQYLTPGGVVHHFGTNTPHPKLEIIAESMVETLVKNPFEHLNFLDSDMSAYSSGDAMYAYSEYLSGSRFSPVGGRFGEYASNVWDKQAPAVKNMLALNQKIYEDIKYVPGATDVGWGADDVLEHRAGVCQDLAHLTISCLRSMGIPARYISGYLYSSQADGLRGDQATHAWAEVLLPSGRWLGIDPTNNVIAGDHHVCVHIGRDYLEVTPTKGVYIGGSGVQLKVELSVTEMTAVQLQDQTDSLEEVSSRQQQTADIPRRTEITPRYVPLAPIPNGMMTQQQQQ